MEALFPVEMASGSVKSQADLDAGFSTYPQLSRTYVQTALYWEDLRKWYENHWPRVHYYLDRDFLRKFKLEEEHLARAWEFHIAAVFSDKGLLLEEKNWEYGPDFCIKLPNGRKLWIEAIACDRGKVDPVGPYPNLLPGRIYSFGGNIEDTHRPRALRITNAIGTKLEKFSRYLDNPEKSGVRADDCLIIAVNGSAIQHHDEPITLFKYSIFGQGPDVLVRVRGKERFQSGFYKPIATISKKSGDKEHPIPANFMEMEAFSKISAVMYCGHTVSHSWLNGTEPGDDFLFGYHTRPDNPVPEGTFKFGRGIRKDLERGSISDINQML